MRKNLFHLFKRRFLLCIGWTSTDQPRALYSKPQRQTSPGKSVFFLSPHSRQLWFEVIVHRLTHDLIPKAFCSLGKFILCQLSCIVISLKYRTTEQFISHSIPIVASRLRTNFLTIEHSLIKASATMCTWVRECNKVKALTKNVLILSIKLFRPCDFR